MSTRDRRFRQHATLTAALLFALVLVTHQDVFAQAPPNVTGTVTDVSGGAVVGATVVAGAVRTVTAADGTYTLTLPPGPVDISIAAPGFHPATLTVQVPATGLVTRHVQLDVEGVSESLLVVGRDYRADSGRAATKTDTPLVRVPQAVQVVTAQVIADQRPVILSDALRNVSGISSLRNSAEVFRSFNIRGFTTLDMSVDGLRQTYALNDQPDAVAHVERIEVAKGPTAALYGRGGLGGTVNLVTKAPTRERRADLSFSTGSWGLVQPTIDVTGALNQSGSVRARGIVDYENRDTPIDFVSIERLQVAPSIEIDLTRRSLLQVRTDYRRREGVRFVALPAYGTVVGLDDLRLPYSLFIGEPSAGATESASWQTTVRLDQQVNARWTASGAVRWTSTRFDMPSVGPRVLAADNRTLTRRFTRFDETEREVAIDGWLTGEVVTGRITHTIVAGVDWSRFEYDSQFLAGGVGAIDISSPVYGLPVTGVFLLDHTLDRLGGVGLYVQDQMRLTDRLDTMIGVRFDRVEKTRRYEVEDRTATRFDTAVSPRLGVAFQVQHGVALFGSYSEGLSAVGDGTANQTGTPFRPQQGHQWEGGLKLDVADGLSMTLALFDLERDGGLVGDPDNPGFQIQTGLQQARGVELDAAWRSTTGLSLVAAYAYTDATVTRDTTIPAGNALMNVPRHSGRLWAKYALAPSSLGRWAIAAGLTAQGTQQANLANSLTIPSSWVADLGLFWEQRRVGVQVNVVNLFDRRYPMRGALGNTGIIPGDTRRVVLTLRTGF